MARVNVVEVHGRANTLYGLGAALDPYGGTPPPAPTPTVFGPVYKATSTTPVPGSDKPSFWAQGFQTIATLIQGDQQARIARDQARAAQAGAVQAGLFGIPPVVLVGVVVIGAAALAFAAYRRQA